MAESKKKKKKNKKGEVLRSQIPEGNKRNRKQMTANFKILYACVQSKSLITLPVMKKHCDKIITRKQTTY